MVERVKILEKDGEFCALEVRLQDIDGFKRLSICGTAGYVFTRAQAKKEALNFWTTYFEDSPEEMHAMNERCGTRFRSPARAARYVLNSDGEFSGLDVYREDDNKVYVAHSCGQIRDEISRWFPEVQRYFRWHLNDMHAECVHQEARGETYQTHPGAVCPDCGYKLGSAWTKRDLPSDVVAWAESVGASDE